MVVAASHPIARTVPATVAEQKRLELPPDEEPPPTGGAPVTGPKPPPKGGSPVGCHPFPKATRRRKSLKSRGLRPCVADYAYRYYDPVTGRWPSADPIGDQSFLSSLAVLAIPETSMKKLGVDALSNLYQFVSNNPLIFIDAFGLYEVSFEIITEIKRTHGWTVPAAAGGIKTRQWLTVETDNGEITDSGNFTGRTFGVIPSLSDFFEDAWEKKSGGDCKVFVTMSGYAQNLANPFLGAINWAFEFEIDMPTNIVTIKSGSMHDGFPSYRVFYGPEFYEFDEISPDKLDDPMDISVP